MRTDRDEYGIPQLWAESVDALAYLQGANAATDRAWQIEVERWRSQGRLAARIGPDGCHWDRFARRVRLDDTARQCFHRLSPRLRRWLTAYVRGVNDALPAGAAAAPEFDAVDAQPGRWRPWSPLGVFLVQHILFGTFPNKLWRAQVAGALGPAAMHLFATAGPDGSGSNAWALTGAHTPHGAPVIAGDPHRVLELPGIYQQIRLACPQFDVIGLAFPGVPGLPHFAHTGGVAWAVTNAMADYQDLYREQLQRTDDRLLAREEAGWRPVWRRRERIPVRGASASTVEVIETPRGPVIDHDRETGEAISLRMPSRVLADLGFGALLSLLHAARVEDVVTALQAWVEPVNSVLVADTTGTVHRLVAGRVPDRDPANHLMPVPGWRRRYRWRGYLPLPRTVVSSVAVTANDARTGDVADLGTDFAPPHRARRIQALLADGADAEAIHHDTHCAQPVLRRLLAQVDETALDPASAALRRRLLGWDGHMAADSTDAGAFAAWRSALARRLYDHPGLRALRTPSRFDPLFFPWTDPQVRIGLALDSLLAALPRAGHEVVAPATGALAEVANGPPPVAWGRRHRLVPVRPPTGDAPDPATAALPDQLPLGGDNDCVLATYSVPGHADACWRGPVARYLWDLGDRDRSRWIVPFGASGRPGDPHFADQLSGWAAGRLIPVPSRTSRPPTSGAE
ncbi:penicillin acylase family protein [Natronosporangium hydrolyticum]|uniref:Penicillin acylase family protein n=1 Tax=Natronosporangium hydrolyticum TaxID=2811111 RepID=A0A895YGJ2_9ACTN|nr:penicillin acylase family protein [Natronosporangium hydrolyticum]QSB12808.1 penicillin acylase family protein [Natronosporangium hydrolyticum]